VPDVLAVADDLTGANAAAAGLAAVGLRAVTVRADRSAGAVTSMAGRYDAVVATTDCRHSPPAEAAERLEAVVKAGWPARLVCNRIDTTLRGNVGATTAAALSAVRSRVEGRVVVLCAPAHPGAGRHTIAGTQLLDGRRLEETEAATDARTPVRTSDVGRLLTEDGGLDVRGVALAEVTGPEDDLAGALRAAVLDGCDAVVVDATTGEHLDRLAVAAAALAADSVVTWVTSDPGPASAALARRLGLATEGRGAPLLVVSGSATELTRTQLQRLVADRGAVLHRTPRAPGSAVPDVDATAACVRDAVAAAGPDDVVVVATTVDAQDLARPGPAEAAEIPRALALAVRRALEEVRVGGLFCTGGDVTAALLEELGAPGVEVVREVEPLAVAGTLVGGPWDGLPVVTKGGLVGGPASTVACVDHLHEAARAREHQVAAAQSRGH
jgi:uncharacterized protein YgbK (DUF1537 family)